MLIVCILKKAYNKLIYWYIVHKFLVFIKYIVNIKKNGFVKDNWKLRCGLV